MKIIQLLLSFLFPVVAQAQGIVNNGGRIVVGTGAFFNVTGNNGHITNATANNTSGTINNDGTITLSGNLINNAANNVFINRNGLGQVIFNGVTGQAIAGSAPTIFENITLNNAAGLSLQQHATTGTLTLSQGPLYLNGWSLTINNSATAAITRTNGYLVSEQTNNAGKVIWNIADTRGAHVFPFGNGSGAYIPFTFNLTAGNVGNVTVATYATNPANQPYPTTPDRVTNVNGWDGKDNSANTVDRFWQIDKDGADGTATLTFTASPEEVGEVTLLQAQRWNAARQIWDIPLPGQSSTLYSATVPDVTNFSPWTLSGNNSPLPIGVLQFSATVNQSRVDLHWKTSHETAGTTFTIKKSRDLRHYEAVATLNGTGANQQVNTYQTQDKQPYPGLSYYRLKVTNAAGQTTYSEVVAVNLNENTVFAVSVYPNPTEEFLNISISGNPGTTYEVQLTDMVGQRYYLGKVVAEKAQHTLQLLKGPHFPAGVFLLSVSGNGHFFSKKVVVQ
ncbi:T9SS type A sorting domain-containing protein [Adhaeribacter swui]|uniref:T9SS type A sorting domain-containing protein n=1 Tax=Adhaeribacter swui TaxID=2086471 RepID=A0A7G7GEJ7_9BACT|nr:T9SS type A sorting domain-containing protein [Adhaeribacter swui]QNF35581.1 T9SS type A sorting domain-containing protein [Adhaeribacter swui]